MFEFIRQILETQVEANRKGVDLWLEDITYMYDTQKPMG